MNAPISQLPAFLASRLAKAEGAAKTRLRADAVENVVIPEGERNSTLFDFACSMRGKGKDLEEIEAAVLMMNRLNCRPPLRDDEVRSVVENVVDKYPRGAQPQSSAFEADEADLRWFPFDVRWWNANIVQSRMRDFERGWFIVLLVELWKGRGRFKFDPRHLWRIVGAESEDLFDEHKEWVLQEFEIRDDKSGNRLLIHPRMLSVYEEQKKKYAAIVEQKKRAGRASAESRKRTRSEVASTTLHDAVVEIPEDAPGGCVN